MKLFFVSLSILCIIGNFSLKAQEKILQAQDSIYVQMEIYPQEKIHLHLDRDVFVPGEKIWFKAYVTDAVTHQSPTYSQYVYVELINSFDSLVTRVMVHKENEMLYGHLFLSEMIPEGNYTVRAYTKSIENLGDDYFFKKNIRIGNLQEETEHDKKKTSQSKTKADYDVSFYPEGGNLLDGVLCRVAFKALNKNGSSAIISGRIVNEKGDVRTEIKTIYAGMGSFAINAVNGEKNYLECQNAEGLKKRYLLPDAISNIYSISTLWDSRNEKLFVSRKGTRKSANTQHYLLVHSRGVIFYFSKWENAKDHILFEKNQLPSGVLQLLLLDQEMNPISERLVFNNTEKPANVVFSTDKNEYEKRDLVSSTIKLSESNADSPGGHFSISITDDKDVSVDSLTTIMSSLLLSSELKGYIETPAYYLQNDKEASFALDHLMMIHGWRRYNIPEVIKGNMQRPEKPMEISKEISGVAKSLFLGKPVEKAEVIIMTSSGGIGQTETNEKGEYLFSDIDFPDSTRFFVQALNKRGKPNIELVVKEETFPKLKKIPHSKNEIISGIESENEEEGFMEKALQRAKYDEDMRFVQLKEVEVVAKRIEKKDEPRLSYWPNSSSDVTIRREVIEERNYIKTEDLLRSIVGITIINHMPYITRALNSSFNGPEPALIILDGMIVDNLEFVDNTVNIESVDVFKGASAAIFGLRGSNGVISITTRRGGVYTSDYKEPNFAVLSPLGYQKPVEFYSPKYDTPNSKYLTNPDYRTTIFWKPDIVVNDKEEAHFEFYTSDFSSTYSVVIEGITNDGRIIRQVEKIEVK